ncbi:MAG TPA: hypothetical protein PKA63_03010 [Oligoflexia bacterium]|nr:hypothetical protein [Oligoflexia bacterium]HMP47624.1 hypothetical protein [Oligoflexia bacterium]
MDTASKQVKSPYKNAYTQYIARESRDNESKSSIRLKNVTPETVREVSRQNSFDELRSRIAELRGDKITESSTRSTANSDIDNQAPEEKSFRELMENYVIPVEARVRNYLFNLGESFYNSVRDLFVTYVVDGKDPFDKEKEQAFQ